MKYIFVKERELQQYLQGDFGDNPITQFWFKIISSMPTEMFEQAQNMEPPLEENQQGHYNVIGAKPYQFTLVNVSEKIESYVSEYAVFVETGTPEIFKWREDVSALMAKRRAEKLAQAESK